MIFLFPSEVFDLKIIKPKGIISNGISFDNAESVSFESIDQNKETTINPYSRIGKSNSFCSLKGSFFKVKKATNKNKPKEILLIAKGKGMVKRTKSIGIKELLLLFSFTRF